MPEISMTETISPDYLIVGAGCVGMGFADSLVAETKATIAIVDSYARPGGHWTIAYPFVTLHQPSEAYGVNSRKLGDGKIDQAGLNKGYFELATGDEIVGYYGRVMHSTLLPSGRVSYYPLHKYTNDGQFHSIATGKRYQVGPNTRIVDTSYSKVTVPSMRPPQYEVSDKVTVTTPNGLTTTKRPYSAYTLVGAGKTAFDSCLWMLNQGIDPKNIFWIMPRDSWFLERGYLQPPEATPNPEAQLAKKAEIFMKSATSSEMFERMEEAGYALRIDKNVQPTMMKIGILAKAEMERVRVVQNIIRLGHVIRIDEDKVTLDKGTYTPVPDTLYIDCSAAGFPYRPVVPIFNGRTITVQNIKFAQPSFSSALLALIDSTYDSDEKKNEFCNPIPYCAKPADFVHTFLVYLKNRLKWFEEPKLMAWVERSRLDFSPLGPPPTDPEEAAKHKASIPDQLRALCDKFEEIVRNDTAIASTA